MDAEVASDAVYASRQQSAIAAGVLELLDVLGLATTKRQPEGGAS